VVPALVRYFIKLHVACKAENPHFRSHIDFHLNAYVFFFSRCKIISRGSCGLIFDFSGLAIVLAEDTKDISLDNPLPSASASADHICRPANAFFLQRNGTIFVQYTTRRITEDAYPLLAL
jgi:hypothetical protein